MKKTTIIVLQLLCVILFVLVNVCESRELLVHVPTYDVQSIVQGNGLMSLLGVPEGDEYRAFDTWSIPTSIVVNAKSYDVDFVDEESGDFRIRSFNVTTNVVARGYLRRAANARIARRAVFASITEGCTIQNITLAQGLEVAYFGVNTNSVFITHVRPRRGEYSYFSHGNLYLRISASSNCLDFATALMNAGLPENERVPLTGNGGTQNP